jgi:hypothetical protein
MVWPQNCRPCLPPSLLQALWGAGAPAVSVAGGLQGSTYSSPRALLRRIQVIGYVCDYAVIEVADQAT